MKVVFRVDASQKIGSGHFMRCLTLANELKQLDVHTRFVSRYLPDYMRDMLTLNKHEFRLLNINLTNSFEDELSHAEWLGTSQAQDAKDTILALSDHYWDWLVVDNYALDKNWESELRQLTRKIFVIDDIADRDHECDLLLDPNLHSNMLTRYAGKVPNQCEMMLGPKYALLRSEFRELSTQAKIREGNVKRILVFFGGMDATNLTSATIQALVNIGMKNTNVDIVIGLQHASRKSIELDCLKNGFTCHVQTNQMASLMVSADLAIGAGGSAVWERCCLGLPTITICSAHNQFEQLKESATKGLLYHIELGDEPIAQIERHARAIIENCFLRTNISTNGMQIVDGKGSMRVISKMGLGNLEIRAATLGDSINLFNWRNHPSVRAFSRNKHLIDWNEHSNWLITTLNDTNSYLLIGMLNSEAVGVVRFYIYGIENEAEISIYLVPNSNTKVRGIDLLKSAEEWCIDKLPKIKTIRACVLGENIRSQHLFANAGYKTQLINYYKGLNRYE